MSITAQQVYATPGRPGGPYAVPPPPIPLPIYVLAAARVLLWQLQASQEVLFILVAEEAAVYVLEV